jgi:hypothetical protein
MQFFKEGTLKSNVLEDNTPVFERQFDIFLVDIYVRKSTNGTSENGILNTCQGILKTGCRGRPRRDRHF